jgi:hypothetical protein
MDVEDVRLDQIRGRVTFAEDGHWASMPEKPLDRTCPSVLQLRCRLGIGTTAQLTHLLMLCGVLKGRVDHVQQKPTDRGNVWMAKGWEPGTALPWCHEMLAAGPY